MSRLLEGHTFRTWGLELVVLLFSLFLMVAVSRLVMITALELERLSETLWLACRGSCGFRSRLLFVQI